MKKNKFIYRNGLTIYIKGKKFYNSYSFTKKDIEKMINLKPKKIIKLFKATLGDDVLLKWAKKKKYLVVKKNIVYRKGIEKISLPKLLIEKYRDSKNKKERLKIDNFWKWCALNPNPEARQDLFAFLSNGDFEISPEGMIYTYRRVDIYDKEKEIYTDHYTGKFRIRFGRPVMMSRDKCDENNNVSCSKGLHLMQRNYTGTFGTVPIVCLLNPKDVTSVPKDDTSKLRCCRYYPVCKAIVEDGEIVPVTDGDIDWDVEKFIQYSEQILNEELMQMDLQEHTVNTLDISNVSNGFYSEYHKEMRKITDGKIVKVNG